SQSPAFNLYGTIFLAVLILVFRGAGNSGQGSIFSAFVQNTIEETAASVLFQEKGSPNAYLADISSLTPWENGSAQQLSRGQGGPEPSLEPVTVQENSIFAHNPAATDYIEKTAEKRGGVVEYTVQRGDKLSFIALDYGVSVESIMWANGLRSEKIVEDQILKIPPVSGVIHTVKKGETIGSIAKKYAVKPENIVAYNSLPQNGELKVNDELIVPDAKIKGSTGIFATRNSAFSHLPNLGDYFLIPATGYNWGRIHGRNGVDVANSCGTSILAAADGTVAVSDAVGWNGGFGKFIKLIHPNGTETLYSHVSKLLVSAGEAVSRGQLIALMGSTGRSTGCHLHFEVHGARNPLVK
ncbi:MAG: peptidoglycan DD-metalloendopeptidase family protein, partial [Patescibacteria group bacterium]